MIPVLVDFGFFKIYSFGLMLALAFFAATWLVTQELVRRRIEPSHSEGYPLAAMIGGLVGARIYYLGEHWDKFLRDPLAALFGGAGLTWYGGVVGGALAVLLLAYRHRQPLGRVTDAFAPGLALAYAIGRIGCQLSGDGDYGIPSDLPWAMAYPNAIVPTNIPVHPTPIYEMLAMGLATWILWRLRTRPWADHGRLFGLYLVLSGIERFLVEFIRTNQVVALGLTAAQLTSVATVAAGWWMYAMRADPQPAMKTRQPKKRRGKAQ